MAADAASPNPAKPGRGGADIPIHPLVTKLLGESGEPQDLVTMVGYIGPSKKEAHVRLYTGLDFQTYYEVPRESVALAEAVDREDENSPTRLMIRADAAVELVQTSKQTGPASYLAGAIAGTYLAGAAASQAIVHVTAYSVCQICRPLTQHSVCVICLPLTRFSICIPCPPPNTLACTLPEPGGPVEVQAQAQAAYPVSVFCPSYAIPCHSQWGHCLTRPPCPLPQAEEQAAAPQAAAMINWPTINCSYFGGCRTRYLPCNTPHCPQAQVGTPQAVAPMIPVHPTILGGCSIVCTENALCTLRHLCPTNVHVLC